MREFSRTPSIGITIGRQSRVYYAFITTAPSALDSPSTVTLYTATLSDLSGFVTADIDHVNGEGSGQARLVLVDAAELAWHRARCWGQHHLLAPADPVLVSPTWLQHWLWLRLQAPLDAAGSAGENSGTAVM